MEDFNNFDDIRKSRKEAIKEEEAYNKKYNKKKGGFLRFLKRFLVILLLLVIIAAGLVVIYVTQKLSLVKYEVVDVNDIAIDEVVETKLEKYRSIALLGVDTYGEGYNLNERTDCIIIATINNETNEVKLTSVYRDFYCDVDEMNDWNGDQSTWHTTLDKVNHAYFYGGAQNTLKSLNKALDLNIKEAVTVNFDAVSSLIDEIGGIDLYITSEEVGIINGYIKDVANLTGKDATRITTAGKQHVNGVQATAYCRIRYTAGSDYKRAERMRYVLEQALAELKKKDLGQINHIADVILPKISLTNIDSMELLGFATSLGSYSLTEDFGFPYKSLSWGSAPWDVPCTLESNVKRLHADLFGETDYEVSATVKDLSDRIIAKTGLTEKSVSYEHENTMDKLKPEL
jgi:LCP family protein required for cell wall assembly